MKNTFTSLLLLLISLSYGQTQFIPSENNEAKRKINYAFKSVITDNGDIINLSFGKKQSQLSFKIYRTLSHFDKELNLIKEKEITKAFKGSILDLQVIENNINIIVAEPHELRMKSIKRYYCPIENFEFNEQTLYEAQRGTEASDLSFSRTNNYMSLVVGECKVSKPNIYFTNANKVLLFNSDFEVAAEFKDLPKKKDIEISDICTLKDGTSLVIIKNNNKKKKNTYSYSLLKINQDGIKTINIDTQNKFVKELKFFIYEKVIYLAGHYSEYDEKNELKGFLISKFNIQKDNQEFVKIEPFSEEYLTNMNRLAKNKKFKQSDHLKVVDFYVQNDSYFLINESKYRYSLSAEQTASNFGVNTWYFGNIGINKFNAQGDLLKYDIIYKSIPNNYFLPIHSPISVINKNNHIYIYLKSSREERDGVEVHTYSENPSHIFELKYDDDLKKVIVEGDNIPINVINAYNHKNDYLLLYTNGLGEKGLLKIVPN